ncbi:Uncharacterised protein [Porphyromonas cangingivalis]|nr:Uncharacterised protein [Porphyromonas cangingivalis]
MNKQHVNQYIFTDSILSDNDKKMKTYKSSDSDTSKKTSESNIST